MGTAARCGSWSWKRSAPSACRRRGRTRFARSCRRSQHACMPSYRNFRCVRRRSRSSLTTYATAADEHGQKAGRLEGSGEAERLKGWKADRKTGVPLAPFDSSALQPFSTHSPDVRCKAVEELTKHRMEASPLDVETELSGQRPAVAAETFGELVVGE